jgi:hypothetical protein
MDRPKYLYEANTQLLLKRFSEKYHQLLRLSTVPRQEWLSIHDRGFDLVWLMGVWQRSPAARQKSLADPVLRQAYDRALPSWTDDDVAGSPYAIYSYTLDITLDEPKNLAALKSSLNDCGLGLILDFVPNHVALDHHWTVSHPEWFVQGKERDIITHPDWFYRSEDGSYLAHGRDSNFPPWTDTAQLNLFSPDLRKALISKLKDISRFADGFRCDMAMLALGDVFERVWGDMVKDHQKPEIDFWAEVIEQVKNEQPNLLFIAEAYWGLERTLQNMGFDFTYDKVLYDDLRFSNSPEIFQYLIANDSFLQHSVHFVENHDEPRAINPFGRDRSLAAAVVAATIPGLCLIHDGQREGRRKYQPIQLLREPEEPDDTEIMRFYDRLLLACNVPAIRNGEWTFIQPVQAWEGNMSYRNILAWCWEYHEDFIVVAVNYSPDRSQALLRIPLPSYNSDMVELLDELTGETYLRNQKELSSHGLYVDLASYQSHFFSIKHG